MICLAYNAAGQTAAANRAAYPLSEDYSAVIAASRIHQNSQRAFHNSTRPFYAVSKRARPSPIKFALNSSPRWIQYCFWPEIPLAELVVIASTCPHFFWSTGLTLFSPPALIPWMEFTRFGLVRCWQSHYLVLACRAVTCSIADSGPSVAKEYIRDNYMCLLLMSCCSITSQEYTCSRFCVVTVFQDWGMRTGWGEWCVFVRACLCARTCVRVRVYLLSIVL